MADFRSGVAKYVTGHAVVAATFPVDFKGACDVSCVQCKFFRRTARICGLTGEISEYPEKYIGSKCPLTFEMEE